MVFTYIVPTQDQFKVIEDFRDDFESLRKKIALASTSSREKSIALTKLEEANMWLNKAIVR